MSPDAAMQLLFGGMFSLQLFTLALVVKLTVDVASVNRRMTAFETPEVTGD